MALSVTSLPLNLESVKGTLRVSPASSQPSRTSSKSFALWAPSMLVQAATSVEQTGSVMRSHLPTGLLKVTLILPSGREQAIRCATGGLDRDRVFEVDLGIA